ncbi:MAG: hypothetical protein P9L92_07085 [Candidatus Electryonea clarkiae]|nr:hypothetical protein [Candidatus Electryonea clarkiae]MDP8286489.1 hypothetical protein [Candidatus Electryonea clarkiae]
MIRSIRSQQRQSVYQTFFCFIIIAGIFFSPALAAAYDSVQSYVDKLEKKNVSFQPYIVLFSGMQEPRADAYDQVFDSPLIRYGGGFGLSKMNFGAEVIVRTGTARQLQIIDEVQRNFSIVATELQLRFYGVAQYKKLSFPAGVGVGLIDLTVDRGYPGEWDRFKGSGFFVGPFIAVEFRPVKSIAIGADIEFAISETGFSANETWHNQFQDSLGGFFPTNDGTTEASFWDTVGGMNTETYDSGGFVFCLRAKVILPTYKEN